MTRCHHCSNEAEILVDIPPFEAERPLCRPHLRSLADGVDARTWLLAGYADWLADDGTYRGPPLPREPWLAAEQALRDALDRLMGWKSAAEGSV